MLHLNDSQFDNGLIYMHAYAAGEEVLDRDARSTILGSCATCTTIRLTEGCSGVLEVLTENNGYGTATDRDFGDSEAMVVCRQLGCSFEDEEPKRTSTDL